MALSSFSFSPPQTDGRTVQRPLRRPNAPLSHRSGGDRLHRSIGRSAGNPRFTTPRLIPRQRGGGGLSDRRHTPRRRGAGGERKGGVSCLLTEVVRRQMKHEMSIWRTTQTQQILYGEGGGARKGGVATCVDARKHTDKRNQFHGL